MGTDEELDQEFLGPPSSEDDTVSLTSTIVSEQLDQYAIDGIVAQKRHDDGVTKYLTKWEGYPEERNTWQSRGDFNNADTFLEWQQKCVRIAKGIEQAFDVRAWGRRIAKIELQRAARKQRRRKKKISLDVAADELPSSSDDDCSEHEDDVPATRRLNRRDTDVIMSDGELKLSRQSSLMRSPIRRPVPWTDDEEKTLVAALKSLGGPHLEEVLKLHGHQGSVDSVLKDRNILELQGKAFDIKQEFVESGREPLDCLKPVIGRRPDKTKTKSRRRNIVEPNKRDEAPRLARRRSSEDSLLEKPKQNFSHMPEKVPKKAIMKERPTKINTTAEEVRTLKSCPSAQQTPRSAMSPPSGWMRTARASPQAQAKEKPERSAPIARMGARGSGPARLTNTKLKPQRRPSAVGIDVTTNWNAPPKRRKSRFDADAARAATETPKKFKNFAIQNNFRKHKANEREPDLNSLVFVDTKTGKAPKPLSTPTNPSVSIKTPMQVFRKRLLAEEEEAAERRAAQFNDLTDFGIDIDDIDTPVTDDLSPNNMKARVSAQDLVNESDRPHIAKTIDTAQASEASTPPSRVRQPLLLSYELPSNAPTGPLADNRRVSLPDCAGQPVPSHGSAPFASIAISSPRIRGGDASKMSLMNDPAPEQRRGLFTRKDDELVIGEIRVGPLSQQSIKVKFVGLEHATKQMVLTIKKWPATMHFDFKTMCLSSEYHTFFPAEPSGYLGSGSVVPYPGRTQSLDQVRDVLVNNTSGGLFFAEQFTMVIWPAGSAFWKFLDEVLPPVNAGTTLRFALRKPLPPGLAEAKITRLADFEENAPDRYQEIVAGFKSNAIQPDEKAIKTIFQERFEIEYDRLIAQNGPQKYPMQSFFLCFVPKGCENYEPDPAKRQALREITSQEHDYFVEFLQENGAEDIYSMQTIGSWEMESNGAWDYFSNNVKSGVIVFHDACIRVDQVPGLARVLRNGAINIWKMSMQPMNAGESHPHLLRLFPHGCVILLTESLILYQPYEALRILMWFRFVQIPTKPLQTWKLAVRPHVREWLLDILDAYEDSQKDFTGHGKQIWADIYTEIWFLLDNPDSIGLKCSLNDYETPKDDASIVSTPSLRVLQNRKEWKGEGKNMELDHEAIKINDEWLVRWFGEWSATFCHNFRKFNVVLGCKSSGSRGIKSQVAMKYEKNFGHIEAFDVEECYKRYSVTKKSKLDEMEANRQRKVREELPANKAEAENSRAQERQSAKTTLEDIKKMFREAGCDEQAVKTGARRHLKQMRASLKEIKECEIDMDRAYTWQDTEGMAYPHDFQRNGFFDYHDDSGNELEVPRVGAGKRWAPDEGERRGMEEREREREGKRMKRDREGRFSGSDWINRAGAGAGVGERMDLD